ncbi:MAG TPA: nuclease-related domain-containing protein [Kiritimatiellia bacterium]|nr:nuclease-related domain-containing protein [Kiritimatiellia bacterium]HMP96839.1 nuclease-related domain-containing protein [Kiritimatiellia bacterium]
MARILTQETSLTRKRVALLKEVSALSWLVRVEGVAAGILLAAGAWRYLFHQHAGLWWAGCAVAALWGGHLLKIRQNQREEKHVQWGLQGEREMNRILEETLDNSHYVINDLLVRIGRKTAQVDHVIISPRGLFAIETKNWGGHIEGDENEDSWTQKSRMDRPPLPRSNPIKQVRRHVEFLAGKLKQAGMDWPDIRGLVVFTSPKATWYVHNATQEILTPREAAAAIARFQGGRTYSESEVTAAVNLFMREA